MGFFNQKKYRQCKQREDGIIECLAYRPDKSGRKIPTAMITAQKTPDCKAFILDEDGDPKDLEELQSYLEKKMRVKCNTPSNSSSSE